MVRLVYVESTSDVRAAIRREKQIKRWNRAWKFALIQRENPEWHDLWPTVSGTEGLGGSPHPRG